MSRFDLVTSSAEYVSYPFDAVGVHSAQYLGAQSTASNVRLRLDTDGYVVENRD